ncbi:MAG TPA: CopD family protein [Thiobacillus sp.]|nr:CopD family protein [Thiobacillus sp.]
MKSELVWIVAFHITGLVIWCAALLYLPALIAAGGSRAQDATQRRGAASLNRAVFTTVATPAALFAIVTGSLLFLFDRTFGVWLILKLTAVTGMVICHVLYGMLILRQESNPRASAIGPCLLLGSLSTALIGTVLWLVLAKPF